MDLKWFIEYLLVFSPQEMPFRMHFWRRKYIWGDLNLFIWLDHEMWRQVVGKGFNVWFVSIVQLGPADISHNYKIWILKTVFGHW